MMLSRMFHTGILVLAVLFKIKGYKNLRFAHTENPPYSYVFQYFTITIQENLVEKMNVFKIWHTGKHTLIPMP